MSSKDLRIHLGCEYIAPQGIVCRHIGVSGITDVVIRKQGDHYEARVGIALLGMVQDADWLETHSNPFSDDFRENYCSGSGESEAEALEDLADNMRGMSRGL